MNILLLTDFANLEYWNTVYKHEPYVMVLNFRDWEIGDKLLAHPCRYDLCLLEGYMGQLSAELRLYILDNCRLTLRISQIERDQL